MSRKLQFHGTLIKENGKLVHTKKANIKLYEEFVKNIPEGAIVEVFSEVQTNDGSLAQLAKIHAMIRELSNHTGYTVNEMKVYIKDEAGMCYTSPEKEGLFCKSFGDCSKEELNDVIKVIEQIGLRVNCPL